MSKDSDSGQVIDENTSFRMGKIIEELVTTGKSEIDQNKFKTLAELAGISVEHLNYCSNLTFEHMRFNHSQIRYGALLLLDQLVTKSMHYRSEIFFNSDDLIKEFVELTIYCKVTKEKSNKTGKKRPIKSILQPESFTPKLKRKAIKIMREWSKNYNGQILFAYRCFIIDTGMEILPTEDDGSQDDSNFTPLHILKGQVEEHCPEVLQVISEMKSCFNLLIPKFHEVSQEKQEPKSSGFKQLYSRTSSSDTPIRISILNKIRIDQTEDNEVVIETLIGLYKILCRKLLPMVVQWMGFEHLHNDVQLLEKVDDLKSALEDEKERFERLEIFKKEQSDSSEISSDESDFEEVTSGTPEWKNLPCLNSEANGSVKAKELSRNETASVERPSSSREALSSQQVTTSADACRVPLGNGNLCSRRDAIKCPFHGRIIPRNERGMPLNPEDEIIDKKRLESESKKKKYGDWQDPNLLKRLKSELGIDLSLKKPKKGKLTFEEKYPHLIPLKKRKQGSIKDRLQKILKKKNGIKLRRKKLGPASETIGSKVSIEEAPL